MKVGDFDARTKSTSVWSTSRSCRTYSSRFGPEECSNFCQQLRVDILRCSPVCYAASSALSIVTHVALLRGMITGLRSMPRTSTTRKRHSRSFYTRSAPPRAARHRRRPRRHRRHDRAHRGRDRGDRGASPRPPPRAAHARRPRPALGVARRAWGREGAGVLGGGAVGGCGGGKQFQLGLPSQRALEIGSILHGDEVAYCQDSRTGYRCLRENWLPDGSSSSRALTSGSRQATSSSVTKSSVPNAMIGQVSTRGITCTLLNNLIAAIYQNFAADFPTAGG